MDFRQGLVSERTAKLNETGFQKIKQLFAEVVDLPEENRDEILREKCGDDLKLFEEVRSLLAAHDDAENIIEKNALTFDFLKNSNGKNYNGRNFGHYTIIREIGHGGMGAVFLAERNDGEFDQQVALKIIRQTIVSSELERHFRRERQILASLNHPNIAKLLDGGVSETGEPFLAMEYVEGETLLEFTAELSIEEKLKLFLKICNAVAFAHRNLVIHRDIKPSNILVTKDGTPKLLDFGLAKIQDESFSSDSTQTAFNALTPAYASPEQLRGNTVSTASDIYSLGVVFYELLSGENPFRLENKSLEEILRTITDREPLPPSAISKSKNPASRIPHPKSLSGDLDNIALMALRKEPMRRYKSVEAFSGDIERHLKDLPVSARPNTFKYRATKFFHRNKIAVAAAVFVILALISGLAIALWQAAVARKERDRAEIRFNDVRKLSNSLLFEITPRIERLQGSTEAREILVKRALEYLDSLAVESQNDTALRSELASAYEKIGELQGNPYKPNLNDFSGAIESYEKAQKIRRNLPQSLENQRLLAQNYRGLGNARFYQNDVKSSLEDSSEALKIYINLTEENPQVSDLKIALIETQVEYAATYSSNNQYEIAVPLFQKAVADLAALDQNNQEIKRLTAQTLAQLANAFSWDDRQTEAETEMTKSVKIIEDLVEQNPNDTVLRQTEYQIYGLGASIYENIKNDISLKFAEKQLETASRAAAADSADLQAKYNLARSFSKVGIGFVNVKQINLATPKLQKAENLLRELIEQEPKNVAYRRDLAILYVRFGDARTQNRNNTDALAYYQKSADLFKNIADGDEKNTRARRDQAQSLKSVGETLTKLNKTQNARQNFQKSFEILDNLKAQNALGKFDEKMLADVKKNLQK